MNKFVLDCERVSQIGENITTTNTQMTEVASSVESYDTSESEEFDFSGAISAIASNLNMSAEKMQNTVILFNKVVEQHTSLQTSMKFETKSSTQTNNVGYAQSQTNNTEYKHNIRKGETLTSIAKAYGTTVSAIAAVNNIENVNLIHTGDTLTIPQAGNQNNNISDANNNISKTEETENEQTNTNLSEQQVVIVPDGLGKVHTYMGWQLITSKSSQQYKLREKAGMNFDSEGFGKIDDRYVVATTTTFGKVGDYVDFEQADGSVLKCIIGDIKNQSDRNCNKWGHDNGQTIVEFVVDKNSWYGTNHSNPGTANCHPEWKQSIKKATNYGNYFDKK